MSNKYSHEKGVRRFYYQPDSHYCAIVAKDSHAVKEIRERILGYYLTNYKWEQAAFVDLKRGNPAGELISVSPCIADFLIGETEFEDIEIAISPTDLEKYRNKKIGLQKLVEIVDREF
jgi:hypothetical protein